MVPVGTPYQAPSAPSASVPSESDDDDGSSVESSSSPLSDCHCLSLLHCWWMKTIVQYSILFMMS